MKLSLLLLASLLNLARGGFMAELTGSLAPDQECDGKEYADFKQCLPDNVADDEEEAIFSPGGIRALQKNTYWCRGCRGGAPRGTFCFTVCGGRRRRRRRLAEGTNLRHLQVVQPIIALGACEDFALMAGSTATCAGSFDCDIIGGYLGVSPAGTSVTGNFDGVIALTEDSTGCAADGLAAWTLGRATTGTTMVAEMGGKTFSPGVHTHGSAINIASTNPKVYLDAKGDPDAVFVFNVGTTLTTCAGSEIVLLDGARKDNVFWVLGTALTMGADSILVGSVLAGSAITMGTNASIMGRAIAQTAVTCETHCTIETTGRFSAEAEFNAGEGSAVYNAGEYSGTGLALEYATEIIECLNTVSATHLCLGKAAAMKLVVYA
jgi:hypothetical protein